MIALLVTLNVLAAVLPARGLIRLLVRARGHLREIDVAVDERGYSYLSFDDVTGMAKRDVRERPRGEVRELWLDLGLVGGGLILGAVANILGAVPVAGKGRGREGQVPRLALFPKPEGTRTPDPPSFSRPLFQLSYRPTTRNIRASITHSPADVHYGLAAAKATDRFATLTIARATNPARFSSSTPPKILHLPDSAWINPPLPAEPAA